MTSTDVRTDPPASPGAKKPHTARYLIAGVALAAVLAVVLVAGTRGGGSHPTAGTGAETAPHINQATAYLLSLNTLPASSAVTAPEFTLTDQSGRPVSPAAFRGKVVVLSFNDDRCQDLCTLLANDVVAANRDLGPSAAHVVFLSVNANPYYPQVSTVRTWTDQHGLGNQPNWYFGTTPDVSYLKSVWKKYGMYVGLDPKTRTVVHGTELFFLDPAGRERAIAEFGVAAANTALFAHGMAQMASDLLPAGMQHPVGGPVTQAVQTGHATVGAAAPVFDLAAIQGATAGAGASSSPPARITLSQLRGHWSILDFWSSTCTACRQQLPHVEQAARALGPTVKVVGIDVSDSSSAAASFARKAGVTYPSGADPKGTTAGAYAITGLPFTVIINPAGQVVVRHPGVFTAEQIEYIVQTDDTALGAHH